MKKSVIIYLIFLFFYSCTSSSMKKADLIIKNARVYTCDSIFTMAESFALKDGKILAVGTDKKIFENYKSENVVDAGGKAIYPGFIDAHSHFSGYGLNLLTMADLTVAVSCGNMLELVRKHQSLHNNFWIQGRGWDQNKWVNKEFPDKMLLDKFFPDNPVYLIRIDGHAALVNSKALEIAGVNEKTKIEGGNIFLKDGKPNGILLDNAMELVRSKIPMPDKQIKIKGLKEAEKKCFEVGLTTVTDAGLIYEDITLIDSLQNKGSLLMRIYAMLEPDEKNIEGFLKKGIFKTDRLSVRSIKLYADGALGSRGACLLESYSDSPQNYGMMVNSVEYLKKQCELAKQYGYQVCTHAIGDSANRVILKIYGDLLKGKNDLRWRIEHAQVVDSKDVEMFGKYNIIPSVQTTHATSDMYWADERLGKDRIKDAYAYKKLLLQNGWLCNGTDFPIENINPLYSFYAAVVRKDLKGFPKDGFQIENALGRREALLAMTLWAGRATFEEDEKGSIEAGKFADFVILDKDIMTIPVDSIPFVKVKATFCNGVRVYGRK